MGYKGNQNPRKAVKRDDFLQMRFNRKLKKRAQRAAKKSRQSLSRWVEGLIIEELAKAERAKE